MKIDRKYILILVVPILLAACSTTKYLPEGEKLYTGASVKLKAKDISSRRQKVLKSDLKGLTRPRPNSRVLGIPFKLAIYNMFRNAKEKSFFGRLRSKFGEPPVLLSSVDVALNTRIIQNHLENKGFFNARVNGDTIVKGKKGSAEYATNAGNQYTIASVAFENDSTALSRAIQESASASFLKKGAPYDLDLIKGERNRIDAFLKERGFYYFIPDHLIAKVDSTVGNDSSHTVDMLIAVKPEVPAMSREVYRINNVYIYGGYNLNTANLDTNKAHAKFYKGYYVIDRRNRFKPKLFEQIMQFKPGEVYNRTDHNQTLNRLINLNEFKFVRNRFEPVPDSPKLDAYYYLTPLPKKSLRAEITGYNKQATTVNGSGSQINLNWRNRNAFRAGEQLSIRAYIGSEFQIGGTKGDLGRNTYRSGAELNFAIPRFVVPFFKVRSNGAFVPRTNIQLGYDILNRSKLYTVNSFRGGLGYLWKTNAREQHEFCPISISYIQPVNVTKEYKDSVFKYPYLQRVIDSQFILGSTYQYNYNEVAAGITKPNSFYFNGIVDLSGNVAGLVAGANVQNGKEARIFNKRFDQYVKLEADGRYYRKLGLNSAWANRIIIGYGNPYGNSTQLPYIKQFFAGGTNSIRAYRSRSVGPGTYHQVTGRFFADQTGDLKLEMNTEYRPHLSGPFYGAVFIDAGNIWLKNEDPSRPGSKFTSKFLSELAVGGGAGLRVDITLFVIRLDVAFP
ncbi:MAG: BamA/TamA family outer membrane protein, partial [Flavisolibacter sp.]|nr:BamA/TamA family outer membrane protein [Flavisolibacter sp.]